MKEKKNIIIITVLIIIFGILLCLYFIDEKDLKKQEAENSPEVKEAVSSNIEVRYDENDLKVDDSTKTKILLQNNEITIDGSGAIKNGNTVTITKAGTYELSRK